MIKKLIVLISLSLMTVSVMAALNPNDFPEEDSEAALALVQYSHDPRFNKKDVEKFKEIRKSVSVLGVRQPKSGKGSKGKKPKPNWKKRAKPLGSTVSDDILNYAYKNDGESFVLLTLLEQEALQEMLRTKIGKELGEKPVCLLCNDTRVNYEKMASHIACEHGGVGGWKEGPEAPFYGNYTGFASSLEMQRHRK